MAKASPILRAFNAGEFSEIMQGRSDIDRFQASLRSSKNFVALPQGPVVRRPGFEYVVPAVSPVNVSHLFEFLFSSDQSYVLEFSSGRLRFLSDAGLLSYPAVSAVISGTADSGTSLVFSLAGHGIPTGDQVTLTGFPGASALNNAILFVTAIDANSFKVAMPAGSTYTVGASATVQRVYTVATPYAESDLPSIRPVQSADVVYLFTETKRPYKLSRYGTYDWRFAVVEFEDGPFMPTNTTGTKLDPSGSGGFGPSSVALATTPPPQNQTFTWTLGAAKVVNGYTLYLQDNNNASTDYSALDYAPSNWTLEVYNGTDWVVIDRKVGYVLWDNLKSVYFKVANTVSSTQYRLVVTACRRNGPITPLVSNVIFSEDGGRNITVTASSTVGINGDAGFSSQDLGRLVRMKGSDGTWTWGEINRVDSTKVVRVSVQGPPLRDAAPMVEWRLGYFSDRTGWPTCGCFLEDRLWLGGCFSFPDLVVASVTGSYDTFSQTTETGQVLDDSAIAVQLNARKLGRISWMVPDDKGLVIGTQSGEHILRGNDESAISARNIRARPTTAKGSARVEPVKVDRQVLFLQRSRRAVREHAYVFEADGYKSPSMTQFASHVTAPKIAELAYMAEPHPVVWCRRDDGKLVSLTYNRDENVVGWYVHDIGATVESMAILPAVNGGDDVLWIACVRNGKRNLERMTPLWDFGMTLDDAFFVDGGLSYNGVATDTFFGLRHLVGLQVSGVADGVPVGPLTVAANGSVVLPAPAAKVVLGVPYTSRAVTARLEAGGVNGTVQGKTKRVGSVKVRLWDSRGGRIGPYVETPGVPEVLSDIDFGEGEDQVQPLFTGDLGPVQFDGNYELSGSVVFETDTPLPFSIVAIMPDLDVTEV